MERIIDELSIRGDRASLRTCSLACTTWLPRCLYHLFKALYVKNKSQIDALCNLLRGSPVLRSLVEEVTIFLPRLSNRSQAVHDVTIALLLGHVPHIRSWSFTTDAGGTGTSQTFRSTTLTYLRQYSSVRRLSLDYITFRDEAEVARLLLNLPTIVSLRCGPDVRVSAYADIPIPIKNRLSTRPRLSTLKVCCSCEQSNEVF